MKNNKEPIEESSFVNIITPRKLYHGSNSFYNTLKATGIDFGNSFQKMGFSLYTWTKVESAMGWAIFCVLKDLKTIDDNLKQINYMNGCLISQTPVLTTQGYEYLKNNISNYSKKDLTFYIYTIDTKNKDYEYGLGHSSNTPNCITIRTKETLEDIPYEKCDEYILDIYLIDKYCIVKDEEPTMKEYGRNKRLMSFFMSYDFMYQGRIKKEIKNAIDSGELNIGDDILKFMKSKNIDIHKVSFKERFVDMFINEATSMIEPITEACKSVSVLDAKSTLTKGFKVKKLNKDIRYIDLHSEEGKRIFMSDPYCKDYSKYIINREWIGELAVDRNKIIGHIFVSTSKKETGFIHSFWINEKYRGYGISRRLLDDAINIYGGYDLVVDKDNEIAKRIYRNKGFVIIGYCDNDTRYHMILEDKVPNKSMIINESLVLETAKYHELYHLSETNLNDMVLKPKVPSNYFTKNGYEDNKTKRVCFTNSIDNSLRAITYKCTGNRFYVHVPETLGEIDLYHPTIREVPDCKITGEVWYTKPIKVKCIGIIEVIGDRGEDGIPFKYGNKTAELYDWDWIWVQKYDNVFESKDIFEKGDFSEYAKYADLDSARGPIEESGISSTLNKDFKSKPRKSLNSFTKKRLTKPMIDEASKDSKLLRHLDPSDDNCFGFYDGNKLACYVSVNKEKDGINWITALEVMPEYRGCGLSKQLLDFATNTLHANALGVSKSNEVALSLYKKYGFKISKESEKEVQSGKRNNYRMYYGISVESNFDSYINSSEGNDVMESMNQSFKDFINTIKTPEELSKWMKRNIRYKEYTKLMTAQEVFDTKHGSCHDQVMFESVFFSKFGLKYGKIFLIEYNEGETAGGRTHSFIYYLKNNKYYWFENAWSGEDGIHGPYNSLLDLKTDVKEKMLKKSRFKNVEFSSVKNIEPGMKLGEFVSACLEATIELLAESTFIEGDKDDTKYYPIFIFLSYTNSNMAKIIKAFTHDPYSHSSISFDTELNHMISFNKEGMVIEDINTSIWKKNKDVIKYSLYMYMATVEEYESIRNFVNQLLDRRNKLKYNMLGLTNFIFGRGSEREDRFFCSEFIASAISAGNNKLINTKPYMTSPCMLARNKNFKFVKKGLLKNYDSKVVDNIVRDILEEGGYTNVVIK